MSEHAGLRVYSRKGDSSHFLKDSHHFKCDDAYYLVMHFTGRRLGYFCIDKEEKISKFK